MKGRVVLMMKRWWITALVFTLALSLTSCARKTLNVQAYSYGQLPCDGSLGNFDAYLIAGQNGATYNGQYTLAIVPITLDAPGDIISVTITNSSLAYKTLIDQVVVNPSQEIDAGPLTDADLATYDILALTPYQAGVSFAAQSNEKDAICYMPQLGDGLNQQQIQPLK